MADYSQITSFAPKDALSTGNPAKKIRGSEFDPEFQAIATAVQTKFDSDDVATNSEAAALTGDAKLITSGKLAYALQNGTLVLGPNIQLNGGISASDVARISVDNAFTSLQSIATTEPRIVLRETDAGANVKNWILRVSGSDFYLSTATDAAPTVGVSNALVFSRSTTTVTIANIVATSVLANGSTIWTAANDGSGSGLDADLLDGQNGSSAATASTVMLRDSSADTSVRYLQSTASNSENPTISQFMVTNGSDGFVRKASLAHVQSQLGVPSNVTSGFYTPSVTTISGDPAPPQGMSASRSQYIRVGNVVSVATFLTLSWISGIGTYDALVSLPVASTLPTNGLHGTVSVVQGGAAITGGRAQYFNQSGGYARVSFQTATSSGTETMAVTWLYEVA